jgi:hypothetical protein
MPTTVSKILNFTQGSSDINRINFNPNGATGYIFSKSLSATAQTVADGTFVRLSRAGRQQSDFTNGSGAFLYMSASMADLFNLTGPKFVSSINVSLNFRMNGNYGTMRITAITTSHPGEAGRWIKGRCAVSEIPYISVEFPNNVDPFIFTPSSETNTLGFYLPTGFPGSENLSEEKKSSYNDFGKTDAYINGTLSSFWNRPGIYPEAFYSHSTIYCMIPDSEVSDIGGYIIGSVPYQSEQYKRTNFGPFGYSNKVLLINDIATIKFPITLRIPWTQNVWSDPPWNKSVRTLATDMLLKSMTIEITYDTINEYKGKFLYPPGGSISTNGGYFVNGVNSLGPRVEPGYLAIDGNFYEIASYPVEGGVVFKKKCQSSILIATADNGSVSSSYPTAVSGYGNYNFDENVSYVTLDASPNYPIVFERWEATDFDGNVSTISYDSTINVYNGLYESIKPIFSTSSPTPAPSPSPSPSPSPGGPEEFIP